MNTRLGCRESHRSGGGSREVGAGTKREFLIDGIDETDDDGLRRPVHYKLCLLVKPVIPLAVKPRGSPNVDSGTWDKPRSFLPLLSKSTSE